MKSVVGAICLGLILTGSALSETGKYNPLAVTCAEYAKTDSFGMKVMPNHQRQNLVVFAIGYAVGEAKSELLTDDSLFRHAADMMDLLCADAKLADVRLIDVIKQYSTLDIQKIVPKP